MVSPTQVVAVYQLADKYDVPALRQLAASRFKRACENEGDLEGFVDAVDAVLESTAPNDDTLWKIVFPLMKKQMGRLTTNASFKDLLQKHEDLNLRLLNEMSLSEGSSSTTGYGSTDPALQPDDDGSGGGYGGYNGGYFGAGGGRTLG